MHISVDQFPDPTQVAANIARLGKLTRPGEQLAARETHNHAVHAALAHTRQRLKLTPTHPHTQPNAPRAGALGLEVHITEMDVRCTPPCGSDRLNLQAQIYGNILQVRSIVCVCGCTCSHHDWVLSHSFMHTSLGTVHDHRMAAPSSSLPHPPAGVLLCAGVPELDRVHGFHDLGLHGPVHMAVVLQQPHARQHAAAAVRHRLQPQACLLRAGGGASGQCWPPARVTARHLPANASRRGVQPLHAVKTVSKYWQRRSPERCP